MRSQIFESEYQGLSVNLVMYHEVNGVRVIDLDEGKIKRILWCLCSLEYFNTAYDLRDYAARVWQAAYPASEATAKIVRVSRIVNMIL